MSKSIDRRRVGLVPLILLAPPGAYAAQRTFVSTAGNDSSINGALSAAITVMDPGGKIVVLDSGGYGMGPINQPVSIIAPSGVYALISLFAGGLTAGQGVVVNVSSGTVTLRGLTIDHLGGTSGIAFSSGDALYLDNVTARSFPVATID